MKRYSLGVDLTFVTGNPAKAEQLSRHLGIELPHRAVDVEEIQSLDLRAAASHKARAAFELVGSPVLVEDVGLQFEQLGKLPGPLVKWFLAELGCEGMCELLGAGDSRAARAEVCFCVFDGEQETQFFAHTNGEIAPAPRGQLGFGWDPIFVPAGWSKTWAEMTPEEQAESSMRAQALRELRAWLRP